MFAQTDWTKELLRFVLAGIGAGLVGLLAHSWLLAVLGGVAGLAVAFAVEYFAELRAEAHRLQDVERQMADQKIQHDAEMEMAKYQLEAATIAAGINAAYVEAYGGAQQENEAAGRIVVDGPTILVRALAIQEANGFNRVATPPGQITTD